MLFTDRSPWAGNLNTHALRRWPHVLLRRVGDRGEWVLGVSSEEHYSELPTAVPGSVGALHFHYPGGVDHVLSRHTSPSDPQGSMWWVPEHLFHFHGSTGTRWSNTPCDEAWIHELFTPVSVSASMPAVEWIRRTPKERYLQHVDRLLQHIQQGDIYEVNYCTERSAVIPAFDPFVAFDRLLGHTDAPYAAFHRRGDRFALCMSPERYLRIEGRTVTTHPMKGTRPRGTDPASDATLALALAMDAKERSENIMAVDVARNDLSRIATSGSVRTPELCEVKTYARVHQLVSTVQAELREGLTPWDAVRASFPMASMTGAPKRRALQLIDAVEEQPRGLFSGSLGFQLPDGTLDLNVVIRTLTYDARTGRVSLITGGAITAQSDPEAEWEECEVKARSVLGAL
jgi:para-aminobenzoate synthetase component I